MTRALVVYCHPLEESFVAAARDRVVAALDAGGAEVRLTDLYAEGFEPEFTPTDRARHLEPGADPSLRHHVDDLQWCDTLILVYPTWWSGQPAMLKGWIDRVWVNGVAWTLPEGTNRLRPALRNVRRLVAVTTHGSAKWTNALEGEVGKRTLTRSLRSMCHPLTRTTWIGCYGLDTATDADRREFLDRVERRITRLT
jgi:putative NADPH-quinone reductase